MHDRGLEVIIKNTKLKDFNATGKLCQTTSSWWISQESPFTGLIENNWKCDKVAFLPQVMSDESVCGLRSLKSELPGFLVYCCLQIQLASSRFRHRKSFKLRWLSDENTAAR